MNPQLWLNAFVQRNQAALTLLREYTEDALTEVVTIERSVRPNSRLPGDVIGMNVRNRVGLRATVSVDFSSGPLIAKRVRNQGIRLIERATGVELPFRKIKAAPSTKKWPGRVPQRGVQELLFGTPLRCDALPSGLHPALVWSVTQEDMLGEFCVLVVDNLQELDLAATFAVASIDPGVQGTVGASQPVVAAIGDDFEDMVRKVPQSEKEAGDTVTGA